VAPIVAANLAACDSSRINAPPAVTRRLQSALFENVAFKIQRRRQLADALVGLDASGYDALLLKSAALETVGVYKHAWVTSARDIDLILKPRDPDKLAPDERAVRSALWASGVECDVNDHEDLCFAGYRLPFEAAWRDAHVIRLSDAPAAAAYVMCPEDLLLTLCVNSCHKWYFRLKILFDVAETLAHYRELDWVRLVRRARASETEGVVFTALCAADETLGLPSEAGAGYSELVSPGRARLLKSMVKLMVWSGSGGLFGGGMLKYASYNRQHRQRAAKYFARHGLNRIAPPSAENALPGEMVRMR
jgi:hypothetical protein